MTIGQQGKLTLLATVMVQSNLLLTAAEQKQLFDNCHWAEKPIMPYGGNCIEHSGINV